MTPQLWVLLCLIAAVACAVGVLLAVMIMHVFDAQDERRGEQR
jgi:hypothetical protein